MRYILRGVMLIIAFNSVDETPAYGQNAPPESVIKQYYRAATRTINTVMPKIRSVLSSREQRMLEKIDIDVDKNDWNIFGVFASRQGSTRKVRFSMGFIIAVNYIDTAVAAFEILGVSSSRLVSYVNRVTDDVLETVRRARRGEPPIVIPSFGEWLGMPLSEWNQIVRSDQFIDYRDIVKLHSFALILGHELAHHFKGHLDNSTSSIEEELEADERGIEIATDADYNTLLSWTPFLFFAALEGDQGIYDGKSSHPPPICRIVRVLEVGLDDALGDPRFVEYLEDTGRYDAWTTKVEELERFVSSGQTSCP